MGVKVFTVGEANRTLPLVRRVVRDIVADHPRWRQLVSEYEVIAMSTPPERGGSAELDRMRGEIDALARRIDGYVRELGEIGCHLKSYEDGTVDFYTRHRDRLVFLCWKPEEDVVAHWHELDAGFAGRRTIAPDFDAEPAVEQTP